MATGGQAPVLTGSQPDVPFLFPDHAGPVLPTDLSVAALVTSIVFALLAIASVALRFYAQRKSKSGIALDGILLLVALVRQFLCESRLYINSAFSGHRNWVVYSFDMGSFVWGPRVAIVVASKPGWFAISEGIPES